MGEDSIAQKTMHKEAGNGGRWEEEENRGGKNGRVEVGTGEQAVRPGKKEESQQKLKNRRSEGERKEGLASVKLSDESNKLQTISQKSTDVLSTKDRT